MKQKYYVELNRQEWRLIIEGLNRFRNKLIAAGRYTDVADDEPEEDQLIGVWGQRHLCHLKRHHKVIYANLLTSGKLPEYLADIDRWAEELFLRLAKQMADAEEITEKLKASDQMEWVRQMNSIRNRAMEIVNAELIFT